MAAAPKGKATSFFTRKVGPAPMWVWIVSAAVLYFLYRSFANKPSSPSNVASNPVTTGSVGTGTDGGGAAGGGGGTGADNLAADQLAGQINSDLTSALLGSSDVIAGLGSQALGYSGDLQRAIIESYTPSAYAARTPIASSGGSTFGNPGVGSTSYSPSIYDQAYGQATVQQAAQTALANVSYSPATIAAFQGYSLAPSSTAQGRVYTVSGYGF